jgi:hypothetical protein
MGLIHAAIDGAWAQMEDTTRVYSTPAGRGRFKVLKSTNNEILVKPVGARTKYIEVPRQAFENALEYLLSTYSISEAKPCEIRSSLSSPGPLDLCTRLKGQMIIQYVLPLLQAAGLVKIHKKTPSVVWVCL